MTSIAPMHDHCSAGRAINGYRHGLAKGYDLMLFIAEILIYELEGGRSSGLPIQRCYKSVNEEINRLSDTYCDIFNGHVGMMPTPEENAAVEVLSLRYLGEQDGLAQAARALGIPLDIDANNDDDGDYRPPRYHLERDPVSCWPKVRSVTIEDNHIVVRRARSIERRVYLGS